MRRKKRPSVTVAAVVHNRSDKVRKFIKSVYDQNQEHFVLKKIVIFSDGSTDNIIEEVKTSKYKKVELIGGRKKLGRSKRLNEIFRRFENDILVILDIDTTLKDKFVIENLIAPFHSNREIALVGGNPQPFPPNTLIESAVKNKLQAQELLKNTINEGNNIYGVNERIFALSKSFIEKLKIPTEIKDMDTYIYLKCRDQNREFVYQNQAIVWFRLPRSITESLEIMTRKSEESKRIESLFPKDLIDQELRVNLPLRIKVLLYRFMNNPIAELALAPARMVSIISFVEENLRVRVKKVSLPRISVRLSN